MAELLLVLLLLRLTLLELLLVLLLLRLMLLVLLLGVIVLRLVVLPLLLVALVLRLIEEPTFVPVLSLRVAGVVDMVGRVVLVLEDVVLGVFVVRELGVKVLFGVLSFCLSVAD